MDSQSVKMISRNDAGMIALLVALLSFGAGYLFYKTVHLIPTVPPVKFQVGGVIICPFDGLIVEGHFVASSKLSGFCVDAGETVPYGKSIIGVALGTAAGGSVKVELIGSFLGGAGGAGIIHQPAITSGPNSPANTGDNNVYEFEDGKICGSPACDEVGGGHR